MVWLSVDWAMPSLAAALVKLRSRATARNHSRSLKSCLGMVFCHPAHHYLCSGSINASGLWPLIRFIGQSYFGCSKPDAVGAIGRMRGEARQHSQRPTGTLCADSILRKFRSRRSSNDIRVQREGS